MATCYSSLPGDPSRGEITGERIAGMDRVEGENGCVDHLGSTVSVTRVRDVMLMLLRSMRTVATALLFHVPEQIWLALFWN